MTQRQKKFRTPTKCQNGHFRWYHYSIRFGEVLDIRWGDKDLNCKCSTDGIDNGFDQCGEDEQFTGLLDKNGQEIYEGDIIQLNCGSDGGATIRHKILALIEWRVNGFIANIPDKKVIVQGGSMEGKKLSWREIHTWCGMHHCLSDSWVKREIIGNIYENTELLTK